MQRNKTIDIIKALAIIMIVDVHLESGAVFKFGRTFHVTAFFLVSGLIRGLKKENCSDGLKKFIIKKLQALIYPYVTLSFIKIGLISVVSLIKDQSPISLNVIQAIIKALSLQGIGTLWFLPVMFFAELCTYFMLCFVNHKNKKTHRKIIFIIGSVCCIIVVFMEFIFNNTRIIGSADVGMDMLYSLLVNAPLTLLFSTLFATGVMMIGYSISNYFEYLSHYAGVIKILLLSLVALTLNIFCVRLYSGDIHKAIVGNPFIFVICTVLGNVFVLLFSIFLSRISYIANWLTYIGRNSLIIMTTHKEFYITTVIFLICKSLHIPSSIISIVSLIAIMGIEIIVIQIVNRTYLNKIYKFPIKRKGIEREV